jgi:anthranilate phosphoribosyltransferase
MKVLDNESTSAQKDVVLANSALAIQCFNQDKDIIDCVEEARISLDSGKAKKCFVRLLNIN